MTQITLGLNRSADHGAVATGPVVGLLQILSTSDTTAEVSMSAAPVGATGYLYLSQSATPPSEADLIAGTGADWNGSFVINGVAADAPDPSGLVPGTEYHLYGLVDDAAERSSIATVAFTTTVPDTVAPVLSAGQVTILGETSAELGISTDEANGTLYVVATRIQGVPSPEQIRLGQDSTGAVADYANGGQAVSAVGVQSATATGLTEAAHYAYAVQDDDAGNVSNILEIGPFTPADIVAPVVSSVAIVANGQDAALVSFDTDTGEGAAHIVVQLTADPVPSAAEVTSGTHGVVYVAQSVTAAGGQSAAITGLSPATGYLAYVVHTDAASNDSAVVAASSEAVTDFADSDFAQMWTQADTGAGFATFTANAEAFDAEKTAAGGLGRAYSNPYVAVESGEAIEITVTLGASTTVSALSLSLSDTTTARSDAQTIDPSGGGAFSVQVMATSAGTFSVLASTGEIGVLDVVSVEAKEASGQRPAALVVGVGQSLMAGRGGSIVQGAGGSAQMAVGGAHQSAFNFWSINEQHAPHWDDWASLATFAEGGEGQSPLAGIANTLTGYTDVVLHSAAIGARPLKNLHEAFYQAAAAVDRGVSLLVSAGYARDEIDVIFAIKHGETDATNGTAQADYESQFAGYVFRCRLAARHALRDPSYVARLHMSLPVQQKETDADRTIKDALLAQADVLPDVSVGEVWSVPMDADRVHPTPEGYVLMGERIGHQISDGYAPMRCTEVTLSGASFTATFNKPVVRDTSLGLAGNLNAANAEDGLEFWDGAAFVAMSGLVYAGNTITGTLASAPSGGELRIAVQDVTSALNATAANHVGCAVRSTDAGWVSPFDPTYTHYDWCIPQIVEVS